MLKYKLMPYVTKKRQRNRGGQTMLTLVLTIGSIIIAAAAAFIVLVIASVSSAYGYRAAQSANAAATAGIQDAMVQLVRNGGFFSVGYTVTSGGFPATVTVSQGVPSTGFVTVVSVATASASTRKLSALFSESTTTGSINLISIRTVQ
jgi:hypothetical protein